MPKRAQRRKPEPEQGGPGATLAVPSGQGVHREVESEAHEEKYRSVIDEGYLDDESVGRTGKVEPAFGRRRRSHSSTTPRCLRTAQYGSFGAFETYLRSPKITHPVYS